MKYKITIYELLGTIKDNKAPKKIQWKDEIFTYIEESKDYKDEERDYLFVDYEWQDMLNDEVEILETTLNTKDMNITTASKKIEYLDDVYKDDRFGYSIDIGKIQKKINEIIDKLNGE